MCGFVSREEVGPSSPMVGRTRGAVGGPSASLTHQDSEVMRALLSSPCCSGAPEQANAPPIHLPPLPQAWGQCHLGFSETESHAAVHVCHSPPGHPGEQAVRRGGSAWTRAGPIGHCREISKCNRPAWELGSHRERRSVRGPGSSLALVPTGMESSEACLRMFLGFWIRE